MCRAAPRLYALTSLSVIFLAWTFAAAAAGPARGAETNRADARDAHAIPAAATPPRAGLLFGPREHAARFGAELKDAWHAYERGRLTRAEKAFRSVVQTPNAPEPDLVQALYGIGLCREFHRPQADAAGALACFTRIVQKHAGSPVAPWALIELGNVQNDKNRPDQVAAQAAYRAVLQRYAQSPAADEAALRLADSLFFDLRAAQMAQAVRTLQDRLKTHPDNPLATIMRYRLDYFYGDIEENYAAALPYAEQVAREKLNDPFRWSRQYWHVGEILRLRLGRPGDAVPWYRKIVTECPDSEQALAAGQILQRIAPGGTATR